MKKNKDLHIDKLLRQLPAEKAPVNFTDVIMKDISILNNEELLKDTTLSTVLKNKAIEEPSVNFVSNVMRGIKNSTENTYQPLIGKKSWFIISLVATLVIVYILYYATPSSTPSILDKTTPYIERLQTVFSNFKINLDLSMIFVASLLSISSLLFFEFFAKERISL